MKKNLARKKFSVKRTARGVGPGSIRWRWILLIVFLALLFCTSALFAIYFKKNFHQLSANSYFEPVLKWLVTKENHNQDSSAIKISATNKETDQQIHYEFYSSLPNMKVSVPEHEESTPLEKEIVKKDKLVNTTLTQENIEEELSKHFQTKMYFLQFGVFKSFKAAERFQKQLIVAGLTVSVVKVIEKDHELYRVQEGPFFSLSQAKLSQKNSQKKGVNGIIRSA